MARTLADLADLDQEELLRELVHLPVPLQQRLLSALQTLAAARAVLNPPDDTAPPVPERLPWHVTGRRCPGKTY